VTTGKYGKALSFNGSNSWVTVADNALLHLTNGMTVEAWVEPTAPSSDWTAVAIKERPGGLAYALYANDGAGRPPAGYINRNGSDVSDIGTSTLSLNTWSHLAVTYDGATIRLYVNGIQAASRAQTGNITSSTSVFRIGGDSVWGEYFTGLIDEVRVYNRALTAAQIQTDMATPVGGGSGALELDGAPAAGWHAPAITAAALAPFRAEAIARWSAAGVSQQRLDTLADWTFRVADLPGSQLGFTSGGTIWIDRDAAGYGWFLDATPADDSEFPATTASPAYGKVDLLTVMTHEIGHALGFEHEAGDGVMAEALPLGVRRMPGIDTTVQLPQPAPMVATSVTVSPQPRQAPGADGLANTLLTALQPTTVFVYTSWPTAAARTGEPAVLPPVSASSSGLKQEIVLLSGGGKEETPVAVLDRLFADSDPLRPAVPVRDDQAT
jgi:hypothetical protein